MLNGEAEAAAGAGLAGVSVRKSAGPREFYSFDEAYVRRLAEGDRLVEEHFTAYFGELLYIKLRARVRSPEMIEDVRQETFLRVLQAVRGGGLEHPERLGAFVHSVCNYVLFEKFREEGRYLPMSEGPQDWPDSRIDLDAALIDEQRYRLAESILAELPKRDRDLLRMVLDGVAGPEACQRLGVEEGYWRVLLHRAKSRFSKKLAQRRVCANKRFSLWGHRDPVKRNRSAVHYRVRYSNGT